MNIDSVRQYQALVEHSTDSITLVDEAGIVQFKSKSATRVIGYDSDELVGENVFEYVHPEDRPRVREAFEEVVDSPSGTTGMIEYRFDHGTKSWTWMESTLVSRTDTALDGYVINTRNISERKARERELEEERRKYSTLVEQSNDGIAIIQDGDIVFTNEQFERLSGYDERELLGTSFLQVVAREDRELVEQRYQQRFDPDADVPPSRYEIRVLTSDDNHRVVELSVAKIQYEGDDASLAMVRDVTERKSYEEALEEVNAELELLNRMVRHDIRNDMSVILAWGQLLEDHVDEAGRENLDKILASSEHVVELTEIARDYVEVLTSDGDLEPKPVVLAEVLETELALRRESFPEAEFVVPEEIPEVEVLANEMLGSVFRNLLTNAVQHNDSDTPVVELTVERRDDDVVVQVADNGPGIPDPQKATVFGKGEKGLDSPSTGIGLYLVYTLVTQYGGAVHIEDNDPRGAVFSVHLPRAE
ncbi:PAS domain S-box-containing protein [Halovenus aranensis]|uniref:histidine kinase n=1 Tax=Halovenus aranensis TaxID=890420 RepID=A0A1G8WH44_9EURY|nr:PAS domain-containing sensor histidine kinase [Halovenus aranensis]SDJ77417.1 PAS domain S-box-containing protein [Halovenus aranensis]